MAEVSGNASVGATGVVSRALRRWPEWMGYAVTTWSLAYGLLGLRWGEVFPRWIPFLSGKRVPIPLGVVPASLVSVLVTTAGLMFVRLTLAGALVGSFSYFGERKLALAAGRTGRRSSLSCCGLCGVSRSGRLRSPTTGGAAGAGAVDGRDGTARP
jgi:hypothetical protein